MAGFPGDRDLRRPFEPQAGVVTPSEPALAIPVVDKKLYTDLTWVLADIGHTVIIPIYQTVKQGSPEVSLGGVNMVAPSRIEVAVNLDNLRIEDSHSISTEEQIRRMQEEEVAVRSRLPENMRDAVGMPIFGVSALRQLDSGYQRETGEPLLIDWFGRTIHEMAPGEIALVGRIDRNQKDLSIIRWPSDQGHGWGYLVRGIVLPQVVA